MKKIQYAVIITKDKDGYFAEVPDLKNCWTQGETFEEVVENIKEAIHCYIEGLKELGEPIPKPTTKTVTLKKPEMIFMTVAA